MDSASRSRSIGPLAALGGLLGQLDGAGSAALTARFEPALAPGLHAALGPTGAYYLALAVFVVFSGLLGRWRALPRTVLAALLATLLALELWAAGAALFARPSPAVLDAALPVPEEWRFAWQPGGAFPNRHVIVSAAVAGTAVLTWLPLGLAAIGLTLCGAATAMYFGAAHATDVAASLLLGGGAAVVGRLGASLAWSGRLR